MKALGHLLEILHASDEHRPQLQKVVVLWVLHLHDAPGVQAASDLLAFGFNQLIGSNHRERDAGLEGDTRGRLTPHGEPQLSLQTQGREQRTCTLPPTAGPLQSRRCTGRLQGAAVSTGDGCTELSLQEGF